MSTGFTSAQVAFAYDDIGRLTTADRSLPGSNDPTIRTWYSYDDADRLLDIKHTEGTGENDPVLSQFSYAYNVANQISSYTGPEGTLNYEYDFTGQLIEVSGTRSESYSFDVNGNRTMTGYETGDGNRLTSDGTYDYEYDAEGNLVVKTRISDGETTEYTWDYRNRLTSIVVTDSQENVVKEAQYTYDVFDRRIGVLEDADGDGEGEATERWTIYDGDNAWVDFDENGSLITRYLYGPEIDQLFARMAAGEVDWYLGDYLGSVRQVVASDATILDEIDYDSFGQILNETDPENGDRFKYTGREWDELFAQYGYRARVYKPDTGTFSSEDPLGFAAGPPPESGKELNDQLRLRCVNLHSIECLIGLDFECTWDEEHGFGVTIDDGEVSQIGPSDVAWVHLDLLDTKRPKRRSSHTQLEIGITQKKKKSTAAKGLTIESFRALILKNIEDARLFLRRGEFGEAAAQLSKVAKDLLDKFLMLSKKEPETAFQVGWELLTKYGFLDNVLIAVKLPEILCAALGRKTLENRILTEWELLSADSRLNIIVAANNPKAMTTDLAIQLFNHPETTVQEKHEVFSKGVFWPRGKRRRILLVGKLFFISGPNEGWKDTP